MFESFLALVQKIHKIKVILCFQLFQSIHDLLLNMGLGQLLASNFLLYFLLPLLFTLKIFLTFLLVRQCEDRRLVLFIILICLFLDVDNIRILPLLKLLLQFLQIIPTGLHMREVREWFLCRLRITEILPLDNHKLLAVFLDDFDQSFNHI